MRTILYYYIIVENMVQVNITMMDTRKKMMRYSTEKAWDKIKINNKK